MDILKFFSKSISNKIEEYLSGQTSEKIKLLEEIRIRTNRPIILKFNDEEIFIDYIVLSEDILETLQIICENSIYSYQNQICNGYITIQGGHRVGISGNCVIEKNKVANINYISSLNFRIARQVIGCSNKMLKYVLKNEENTIYNTLIISPPGARKNYYIKRFNKKYKQWSK